jgi:hypothetical protein
LFKKQYNADIITNNCVLTSHNTKLQQRVPKFMGPKRINLATCLNFDTHQPRWADLDLRPLPTRFKPINGLKCHSIFRSLPENSGPPKRPDSVAWDLLNGGNYSGFRVQAINVGSRHSSHHPPAWTMGAGGDQAQAIASFLNPEPLPPE